MWMTPQELHAAKYNIDLEYEPMMKVGEPPFIEISENQDCLENCCQFYERNGNFVRKILKDTEKTGLNYIFHCFVILIDFLVLY